MESLSIWKSRTFFLLKPVSTPSRLTRVRTNRPAPTSRRRDKATCDTSNVFPTRLLLIEVEDARFALNDPLRSTREARIAGAIPNTMADKIDTTNVKDRTRTSGSTFNGRTRGPV